MRTCALLALLLTASAATAQTPSADPGYRIGVVSESGDIVTWLVHRPGGLAVDRVVPVGIMPADIDGPHNLAVAPDGRAYYVSIAHGQPYGTLWKLDSAKDTLLGRAPLELFPTTIALTPDGDLAFVANSDFHGDHPRENVVSVIHTPSMTKITDLPVCDMPHGVKADATGLKVFVSCMHSDELVEVDVSTISVARRAPTGSGHAPTGQAAAHPGHTGPAPPAGECAPTFVAIAPDQRTLYVACNKKGTLQQWDAAALRLTGEIPVGAGAYNVEPTPDGRWVLVTNKKAQSVSLVEAATFTEVARIATTKKIVHGIAFSPDGRYAYISSESIGADPGSVDALDLGARRIVATIPVPAQPTGIAVRRIR